MEEIAISTFKANCSAVLERVWRTKEPIRVTRFGVPVAEITPPHATARRSNWIGSMAGTGENVGDIVSPATAVEDRDALRA